MNIKTKLLLVKGSLVLVQGMMPPRSTFRDSHTNASTVVVQLRLLATTALLFIDNDILNSQEELGSLRREDFKISQRI